jgi:hypothetical protein
MFAFRMGDVDRDAPHKSRRKKNYFKETGIAVLQGGIFSYKI